MDNIFGLKMIPIMKNIVSISSLILFTIVLISRVDCITMHVHNNFQSLCNEYRKYKNILKENSLQVIRFI